MKKPKKTLKDLGRVESLLSKQTSRAAKLLARRKTGDSENPVTAGYYERIAAQQSVALTDLSEITHLIETLSRQIVEADAAKDARKAAKTTPKAPKPARAAKPDVKTAPKAKSAKVAAPKTSAPKTSAAKTSAPKTSAATKVAKTAVPKAPTKRAPVKAAAN
jgi:hypothetical protein